jgi:hypothetical protein
VKQLIDDQTNSWREAVIRTTFLPYEAATILGISLSSYNQEDTAIWGETKSGIYAVRSGYHFLLNESHQDNPGSSDTTLVTHIWNTIWSLQVPMKIRHFLWCACHESLLTRKNLHHRHVQANPRCLSYTVSVKSTLHALWQCNSLNEIWLAVPWGGQLKTDQHLDFMELMQCCIRLLYTSDLQLFAVITWSIWNRQNCLWRDQPTDTNDQLIHRAQRIL